MRKTWILGTAIAATLAMALPVAAESPDIYVGYPFGDDGESLTAVDNPCTDEQDEITFTSSTKLRVISFPDGRTVKAASYEIFAPEPWTGTGTDTGLEQDETSLLLSTMWVVTNSETGQKFNATWRAHLNVNTGEWTDVHTRTRCVRP